MGQIVLQFSAQADLGSWAIREFERGVDGGQWSHVDAELPDGSLLGARSDVVAGIPAGVRIRPAGYAGWLAKRRVVLSAADEIAAAFYEFNRDQIGKPYDDLAIAAFVAGRDWRSPDAWFCSELQGRALEVSRYLPHPLATPWNRLTPDGLFLVLSVFADLHAAA